MTTNLSAAERADITADFAEMLTDVCYILRTPQVLDDEGGWGPGATVTTGPHPCAYGPLTTSGGSLGTSEGRRGQGVQIAASATAQIAFAAGTDVLETDRIQVHLDGLTAEVLVVEVVQVSRMGREDWRIVQVQDLRPGIE